MTAFLGGGGWFCTETDQVLAQERTPAVGMELRMAHRAVLDQYCVTCHNERIVNGAGAAPSPLVNQLRAVGLTLGTMDLTEVEEQADAVAFPSGLAPLPSTNPSRGLFCSVAYGPSGPRDIPDRQTALRTAGRAVCGSRPARALEGGHPHRPLSRGQATLGRA